MRATDFIKKSIDRSSRFIQQNSQWFFKTREGEIYGPYESKEEISDAVDFYIALMDLHECGRREQVA
ncbi:DUF6316 family protein [Pleionea sediminis]|uniref:DUF6316 family protein n=1 Tax=Pleionea sediminis TaxID=2569479 RepID=UPI001185C67C|nr:DUF6316 family protein [Pleionea sediminis]